MRTLVISSFLMVTLLACQYGDHVATAPSATSGYTTITIPGPPEATPSRHCFNKTGEISVLGSDKFRQRTSEALDRLPAEYRTLVHCWLKSILERSVDGNSGQNGTYVRAAMFYAGSSAFEYGSRPELSTKWYAAGLVHEAVHVREYRNKRPYYGRDGELTALTVQLEALKALDAPRSMTRQIEDIIKNIDDPAYQYWNTPAPATPATD
jgi:hypothetical protein